MFGALASLFGKSGIDKIVDGAVRGIDALKYTAEEKAADAAKRRDQEAEIAFRAQGQVVEWIKAMQPAARARRWMMMVVVSIWTLTVLLSLGFSMAGPWFPDQHDEIMLSVEAIRATLESTDELVYIILAFYFGSPTVMPLIQAMAVKRFGGDKRDTEQT